MDGQRFDELARAVARSSSRRSLLRSAAGGAGAGLLALVGVRSAAADNECKPANKPQSKCNKDAQCCTGLVCSPDRVCQAGCHIEGTFYPEDAVAPENPCLSCQPTASTTAWSNADGASCETGNSCAGGGVCRNAYCEENAAASDGTTCDEGAGTCVAGTCCVNGLLAGIDFCNPEVNTSVCCTDGEVCCALHGCCRDCFRYSSHTSGAAVLGYVYECCSEEDLCPPRTSPDENPLHCCSGSASVCITSHPTAPDGCYRPEQVCQDGSVCDVPCCGGTCCGPDTVCAEDECRLANRPCVDGNDCGSGEQCVGATYEMVCDQDGCREQVVVKGECCAGRQIGSIPYEAIPGTTYTKDFCCDAGTISGADGGGSPGSRCCSYPYYLQCNACHTDCTPNGGRTRI